jgi:23S rRNA (pseudouridine1915-N3)-methyltransferase
MKISLLCIGKTNEVHISEGVNIYQKRIQRYTVYQTIYTPEARKNLNREQQKIEEGQIILKKITTDDFLILLDEKGVELDSVQFAGLLEKHMIQSTKNITFVIGGPYGFSEDVYKRANYKLSLSKMTFSHQVIRLIFAEQLYRAFTIIKGEPYHHI